MEDATLSSDMKCTLLSHPDPAPSLCLTSYTTQWKHCNICSINVTIIYSYFASFHNSKIFSRSSHYSNKRKLTKCFSRLTSYKNFNFMLSIIKSNPIFMRSLAELLPTYKIIKCNCNCNTFVTLVTRRGQYLHSCSKQETKYLVNKVAYRKQKCYVNSLLRMY